MNDKSSLKNLKKDSDADTKVEKPTSFIDKKADEIKNKINDKKKEIKDNINEFVNSPEKLKEFADKASKFDMKTAMEKIEELPEKAQEKLDQCFKTVETARTLIIKLIANLVVLWIAVQSFFSYLSSQETYEGFLSGLSSPLVVDVKLTKFENSCPANYSDIIFSEFPGVNEGCRCDKKLMKNRDCKFMYDKTYNMSSMTVVQKEKKKAELAAQCTKLSKSKTKQKKKSNDKTTNTTNTDNTSTETSSTTTDTNTSSTTTDTNTSSTTTDTNTSSTTRRLLKSKKFVNKTHYRKYLNKRKLLYKRQRLTQETTPTTDEQTSSTEKYGKEVLGLEGYYYDEYGEVIFFEEGVLTYNEEYENYSDDQGNYYYDLNEGYYYDINGEYHVGRLHLIELEFDENGFTDEGNYYKYDEVEFDQDGIYYDEMITYYDQIIFKGIYKDVNDLKPYIKESGFDDADYDPFEDPNYDPYENEYEDEYNFSEEEEEDFDEAPIENKEEYDEDAAEYYNGFNDEHFDNPGLTDLYGEDFKAEEIKVENINGVPVQVGKGGIPVDAVKMPSYPKKCKCFKDINPINPTNLTNFDNQRICVKFDKTTSTKQYLQSVKDFRKCKKTNRCQKYFCKSDNSTCPIIDVQLQNHNDKFILKKSATSSIDEKFGTEYLKSVILPLTNIKSILTTECVNSTKVNPGFSHPLFNDTVCVTMQVIDPIYSIKLKNLLNLNGNLYDKYSEEIPEFAEKANPDMNYYIASKHAIGKHSVSCFLQDKNVSDHLSVSIDKNFNSLNTDLIKINNIVFLFVRMENYFKIQFGIQLYLVMSNAIQIVIVSMLSVVAMFACICKDWFKKFKAIVKKILNYLALFIDLTVIATSLLSYIYIAQVIDKIKILNNSGCNDLDTETQIIKFVADIETIEENSKQMFFIILFKLLIILVSYIICVSVNRYYGQKIDCKQSMKIVCSAMQAVFLGDDNKDDEDEDDDKDGDDKDDDDDDDDDKSEGNNKVDEKNKDD